VAVGCVKFVATYEVYTATGALRYIGQRDIDSPVDLASPDKSGHDAASALIAMQLVVDPTDRIVVTDIRAT
jgi:hypothetical protein